MATSYALAGEELYARYGSIEALHGVSIGVEERKITAIVGPNGAGKSTLMSILVGLQQPAAGTVLRCGDDINGMSVRSRLLAGMSLCPERRRIFPQMTVEENLLLGGVTMRPSAGRLRVREMFDLVPWMKDRRSDTAGNLSGGQQQMLAILRAMMTRPDLLLLDEPSLGLAPRVVGEVAALIRTLASQGVTVLIVEQNVALGVGVADTVYVLDQGSIAYHGPAAQAQDDPEIMAAYLG